MTQKEKYIKLYGFTENEYDEYKKEAEIQPSTPEEYYRHVLALSKHWISEDEFLRLYSMNDNEEIKKETSKLSARQVAAFSHLFVAYQRLQRERKDL